MRNPTTGDASGLAGEHHVVADTFVQNEELLWEGNEDEDVR